MRAMLPPRRLAVLALLLMTLWLSCASRARAQGVGFTFGSPTAAVVSGHYDTFLPFTFRWTSCPPGGAGGEILLRVTEVTSVGGGPHTFEAPGWPTLTVWHLPAQFSPIPAYTLTGTLKVDIGLVCQQLFPGQNVSSISYYFEGDDNLDGDGDTDPGAASATVTTTFGSG